MLKKNKNTNRKFYKPCYRFDPYESRLRYNVHQDKYLDLFNHTNFVLETQKKERIRKIRQNIKEFLEMNTNQEKEEVKKSIENHKLISALVSLITADINEEIADINSAVGHINLECRPFGLKYCIQTVTLTNNRIYQRLVTPDGVSTFKLISSEVQK